MLADHYKSMRNERLKPWHRTAGLTDLRMDAAEALDAAGIVNPILAWALEETDPDPYP